MYGPFGWMDKFIGCLWMNFVQIIINLVQTNVVWFLNSKGTFDLDFIYLLLFFLMEPWVWS